MFAAELTFVVHAAGWRGSELRVSSGPADLAMARYAAGDDGAFGDVFDALAPRIHAFLLRRSANEAIADDVLQQTFLRIHLARGQFQPGADVLPWAFAIARRLLVDRSRRHRREVLSDGEVDLGSDLVSLEPGADEQVSAAQLARRLDRELAKLPAAQREAFELVKCDELSMSEAASVLGTTVSAVKLRAHRAYVTLREALGDLAGEAPSGKGER